MATPSSRKSPILNSPNRDSDMNRTIDPPSSPSHSSADPWTLLHSAFKDVHASGVVEGLTGAAKAFYLVHLWKEIRRPIIVITADQITSESLFGDLRYFIKHNKLRLTPHFFPAWELLPYEPLSPLSEVSGERLDILHRLMAGKCPFLIVPIEAALQYLMPRAVLKNLTYPIKRGEQVDRELLELCLVDNGFVRAHMIEERGQFSSRGDILDIYLSSHVNPTRIEFFGDEVESIRYFDVVSQISIEEIERIEILPVREICLTDSQCARGVERILRYARENDVGRSRLNEVIEKINGLKSFPGIETLASFFYDEKESLFDYLSKETLVVWDDSELIQEKCDHFYGLVEEEYGRCIARGDIAVPPSELYLGSDDISKKMQVDPHLTLNTLKLAEAGAGQTHQVEVAMIPAFQNTVEHFMATAEKWQNQGMEVVVVAPTKGHVQRLNELLVEHEMSLVVEQGQISSGFRLPELHKVFVAEHEIFGRVHKHRYRRKPRSQIFQRGFKDLKEGDFLVHVDYGIGKYLGTKEIQTGVGGGEFLEILYDEDQKLYIPMEGLAYIQKYSGGGDDNPPLNKLGGAQWKRQKKKVKESIREMAEGLLKIYAARELAQGLNYSAEPVIMQEFADSFEYVETEDQMNAIEDVLNDLGGDKPMDRLICGDVGYGKTEVAMRAVFKAVLNKKQVAVLVPTTILAQQHLNTFRERFQTYPVNVEMISRFRTPKEQRESLKKLKEGKLDVVIGTHRLLSKDVQFKDLGLVIIDEEQRFGVRHKEQLKKLRSEVDILTLTATPIPRTLNFSLMGIRDMSVIETPPSDRLAVKTYIRKFDEELIREGILRELDRNGQIYFVHNKVRSIHSMAGLLRKIVPEVRIGIAHGQMQERMLESVMRQFIDNEIDLLLCTSIIESGLDIPTANTIFINRADQFGLAQLYQLRGRVGRYKHQAYAYLLIPGTMAISSDARKRLFAIEEMSELGAGFQLATRDMEIRGTGNMLGRNQSGRISAVGFDLYCQMLEETIKEMKGEKVEHQIETEIDLQVKGFIPNSYIADLNQRLEIYRRLQSAVSLAELVVLNKELDDRYGKPPEEVEKLFALLEIKFYCRELHVTHARWVGGEVTLTVGMDTPLDSSKIVSLLDQRMKLLSESRITIRLDHSGWRENLRIVKQVLIKLWKTLNDDEAENN